MPGLSRVKPGKSGKSSICILAFVISSLQLRTTAMAKLFFVYILANRARGVLYVGVTGDLAQRIMVHKAKLAPGFTKTHGVVLLVHYEEYASIVEARARERTLKRWRREWKIALVEETNPGWRDLADELAP